MLARMEKLEPFCTVGGNIKWYSHCGKYGSSLKKKNLPYDPAIPLLDIHPKELKLGP